MTELRAKELPGIKTIKGRGFHLDYNETVIKAAINFPDDDIAVIVLKKIHG